MAMRGGPRLQVGSAAWIAEERESALSIARSEIEEFSFSARNEIDWLNEHMAEIFSDNQMNVAELFKTPGKLRGKTPRTARKAEHSSLRKPLSNMFPATPKGAPNPFAMSSLPQPRSPPIQVAEDKAEPPVCHIESPAKPAVVHPPHRVEARAPVSLADSGYHGSQSQDTIPFDCFDKDIEMSDSPQRDLHTSDPPLPHPSDPAELRSPSAGSVNEIYRSIDENQTTQATAYVTANSAPIPLSAMVQPGSPFAARTRLPIMSPRSPPPKETASPVPQSPQKSSSPLKLTSPRNSSFSPEKRASSPGRGLSKPTEVFGESANKGIDEGDGVADADEVRSPSDASSPIRPIVRKSSMNFASLPPREPLASNKSLGGARVSRTSHLGLSRQSYPSRQTEGKSLGSAIRQGSSEDEHDDMDVDEAITSQKEDAASHSRSYTQMLQDQISMLGKAQSTGPRPSKSLAILLPAQQSVSTTQLQSQLAPAPAARKPSPRSKHSVPAPGAFPEDDDEDEWIRSPNNAVAPASPKYAPLDDRPSDPVEDASAKSKAGESEFGLPKSGPGSPAKTAFMPERTSKHGKSASVPTLPTMVQLDADMQDVALKKIVSISNPTLSTVAEDDLAPSPPKSPTRSFRDSPLKQIKNKVTSLIKGSKVLMAGSAAISAEAKLSLLQSPSMTKLGYHPSPSVESFETDSAVVYPDLSRQISATSAPLSPSRSNSSRRTRASAERERLEAKERERHEKEREREKEKEMKEAKRLAEQMDKLERVREEEREKARVFSEEQERIAAMEKRIAARKEQEKAAQRPAQPRPHDIRTSGPGPKNALRSPAKPTATPRRIKGQTEQADKGAPDELDMEMTEATTAIPPQSISRPATASSMRQGTKRPLKPTKDPLVKPKQAPKMILVNTTASQQVHSSNSIIATTLQDTLGPHPGSAKPLNGKASQTSLHGKASDQSFKSSASSSTNRPRALDMAAKLKQQEKREAQRKRDAKLELERKRAAQAEERRQEQQRKLEAERQREEERKAAQRKADIEKAKQTKAPPPATRSQPNGPPQYNLSEKATARPPSRLGSMMHQGSRLVNTDLSSGTKGPSKRPLPQEAGEESSRAPQQQRALTSFPSKEEKRMRMSVEFDEDIDMMETHNPRIIKGPPIRPSTGFKKDVPKPMYGNGYTNPPSSSASRDFFKDTVRAQHNQAVQHPLDMAKFSKGTIPFAPQPNPGLSHHTPVRPGGAAIPPKSAKPVARSSPRFQNGEAIELPDIQTDDDSDDDDDGHAPIAPWADSPALKAALLAQERVDPMQVFGPPAPLNMEEVFNKTKDRWNKFRARTSSANWSGADRLTEEEMRKDLAARDRMRRDGGWSYELSKEVS
ncbi:hypothetical protein N657DRAFT_642167 [Parathielavia appendiculata]|uniref:Inner centromere protein ARK-binding domain-containing protein n=1 Tax=Parathielavia appendiculata TaxID=2587402 RepID=A0AAN6U5H0_9PEZI|nr:hypothetical protein N657DRAFT_642167 [Parathielavia appendiculata]